MRSVAMAYPAYLKERARALRVAKKLSLDEIAVRLALPKTTVYYWIRDLPLGRERRWSIGQRKGNAAMQAKYRRLREEAYAQGLLEYDDLIQVPTFRDFVVLYVAEGYKRHRNYVAIGNSDARVVAVAASWLARLTSNQLTYSIQYHADQNLNEITRFWASILTIDASAVTLLRKSNSGQLNGRRWRSAHGVLTVRVADTLLRARLQAWIDRVREDWGLDSAARLGA
jgi:transcriptional regulator with XRE-family HTH domain